MTLRELNIRNRSYRRFDGSVPVTRELLLKWIDTARMCMSAVNFQPLKYRLCLGEECEAVRPLTHWAGLLQGYAGPQGAENPGAYVVICCDKNIVAEPLRCRTDVGIAAQTLLLAAVEDGFGGCMIGSFDAPLRDALALPEHLVPVLVVAFGKPDEKIVLEELPDGAPSAYYRDADGVHHVPKRLLADIVID